MAGKQIPMKVLEVNGDRATVEVRTDMVIRPRFVDMLAELILLVTTIHEGSRRLTSLNSP